MNWEQIEQESPKAKEEYVAIQSNLPPKDFNPRELYDYFDGLGIYGSVRVGEYNENGLPDLWEWEVTTDSTENLRGGYDTRTAAESALFTRMFEIRESQLLEGEAK